MKKSDKKKNEPAKTAEKAETLPAPPDKTPLADRARIRAEASRKAALNKAVAQSPA